MSDQNPSESIHDLDEAQEDLQDDGALVALSGGEGGDGPPSATSVDSPLNSDNQLDLAKYAAQAYLEYAVSVIKGRALPSVNDGMKPVQVRILYAMVILGLTSTSKPVKSARVVGDVIGKYHPHGDQSVYDAAVRISQEFSLRYPLIDGQGNFGSRDGDGAAAMRYTEMRLTPIAEMMISEIERDTVDFRPNYDGSFREPVCLPSRLPMILLNGASGIAVGMATEIPSHNLREVVGATLLLIRKPEASLEEILALLPGPDFPNGGQIISSPKALSDVYAVGRGSIRLRAQWRKEDLARGQWRIIVSQHAHGVSTAAVLNEIETHTNPKPKEGKKELSQDQKNTKELLLSVLETARDESSSDDPVRLVLEPRTSKISPDDLMAALYRYTGLESTFSVNMTMIGRDGNPRQKGLIAILKEWIDFRYEVVDRRTRHRLAEVRRRIHILEGRLTVFLHLDEVIKTIRESDDPKLALIARFNLSEIQADDILEIRLRQLARLEGVRLQAEVDELRSEEGALQGLLDDRSLFVAQVVRELEADSKKFGDDRRTVIEEAAAVVLNRAAPDEPVTVFVSEQGWVRVRAGHKVDTSTMPYKVGDAERYVLETRTIHPLIVLDTNGRAYSLDVSAIPAQKGDGLPLSSLIQLVDGGKPLHVFSDDAAASYLFSTTGSYGFITQVGNLVGRSKSGKQFQRVEEKEEVLAPVKVTEMNHWVAACSSGPKEARMVLFPVSEMKIMPGGKGVVVMGIEDGEKLSLIRIIPTATPTSLDLKLSIGKSIRVDSDNLKRFLLHRARKGCQVGKNLTVLDLR